MGSINRFYRQNEKVNSIAKLKKYLEEVKELINELAYLTDMDNYTPDQFVPWIKKDAMKELDEDCGEECINIGMLIESSINFVLKKAEEEDE